VALGLQPLGHHHGGGQLRAMSARERLTRSPGRRARRWSGPWRNIARYGGDPTRLALGGHSAGAHLTAMCLQTPWTDDYGLPTDPLAAALLISGIYDIAPLRYSYLQAMIQLDDGIIGRNSPLFSVRPCKTPVSIHWGAQETPEFARQSTSFHQAWLAMGNTGTLSELAGADHYRAIHGLEDSSSVLSQYLSRILNKKCL
jgi:arylformamidase